MLTEARFHRRRDTQGLMNPRKVVVNVEQRKRVNMVINALAERVRQAREPAHLHPHVEILSFDEASRDMLGVWVAENDLLSDAQTLSGAVPLLGFRIVPENLDKLRVVDLVLVQIPSYTRFGWSCL